MMRDGGDRELVGVEPAPGIAGAAIDGGLEIDLAHALEMADEEGVDGHQVAGMAGADVAFAELGAEPRICSWLSSIWRSQVVFSSLNRRSCLVSSL